MHFPKFLTPYEPPGIYERVENNKIILKSLSGGNRKVRNNLKNFRAALSARVGMCGYCVIVGSNALENLP